MKKKTIKKDYSTIKNSKKQSTMQDFTLENLIVIAKDFAAHFGKNCEICIHDMYSKELEHTILYIENGHVTNRKVGDSPSDIFLHNKKLMDEGIAPENKISYTQRTKDGKYLKSSTIFLKDQKGKYRYMLCINQDMSSIISAKVTIDSMLDTNVKPNDVTIQDNVVNLLDSLINKCIEMIGKSPSNMTKDDKKKAIKYLNDAGAFLITGSGDTIANWLNISKFTLYSYMNIEKNKKGEKK